MVKRPWRILKTSLTLRVGRWLPASRVPRNWFLGASRCCASSVMNRTPPATSPGQLCSAPNTLFKARDRPLSTPTTRTLTYTPHFRNTVVFEERISVSYFELRLCYRSEFSVRKQNLLCRDVFLQLRWKRQRVN